MGRAMNSNACKFLDGRRRGTISRAREPGFVDITSQDLWSKESYKNQLLHGVDLLAHGFDGACGDRRLRQQLSWRWEDFDNDEWMIVYLQPPEFHRSIAIAGEGIFRKM